jgi:hypothetical protein
MLLSVIKLTRKFPNNPTVYTKKKLGPYKTTSRVMFCFDKEKYINIAKIVIARSDLMAIQMHLVTADQTPPKQHQKSINFKSDAFKKGKIQMLSSTNTGLWQDGRSSPSASASITPHRHVFYLRRKKADERLKS